MSNRAEERRKQRQQERGRGSGGGSGLFTRVLVGVGILAGAIVVWNLVFSAGADGAREPVHVEVASSADLIELAQGVPRGDPDAPLTLMDFSDYQCPGCAQFTFQTKPIVDREYVDQGLVQFVYYDFPLVAGHRNAFLAARAARCAGDQDGYWPYHDRLFQQQPQWAAQSDPFSTFVGYAAELGLDRGDFRACLGSDRHAEVVTANMILGQRLGVSSTPTLFLDTGEGRGQPVDPFEAGRLRATLDDALARLGHAPDPGDEAGDDPADDPTVDPTDDGTGQP